MESAYSASSHKVSWALVINLLSLPSPWLFIWYIGVSGWTWHVESQVWLLGLKLWFHSHGCLCCIIKFLSLSFTITHLSYLVLEQVAESDLWNPGVWVWDLKHPIEELVITEKRDKMLPLGISHLQLVGPGERGKMELVPRSYNYFYFRSFIFLLMSALSGKVPLGTSLALRKWGICLCHFEGGTFR
jgi:hypothetical protein